MWRSLRDESYFDLAETAAWEFVLPQRCIPILPEDENKARALADYLRPLCTQITNARTTIAQLKDVFQTIRPHICHGDTCPQPSEVEPDASCTCGCRWLKTLIDSGLTMCSDASKSGG